MEEKIKPYPKSIQELNTAEGFIHRYELLLQDYSGDARKAYEATERQFKQYFIGHKYNDYDSFRVTLSRFRKKMKNRGRI